MAVLWFFFFLSLVKAVLGMESGTCPAEFGSLQGPVVWRVRLFVSTLALLLSFLPRQYDFGLTLTWNKFSVLECRGPLHVSWGHTCQVQQWIGRDWGTPINDSVVSRAVELNQSLCIPVPCFSTSFDDCLSFLQRLLAASNLESLSILQRPVQKDLFRFTTI